MLLLTLGAGLLENILDSKGVIRTEDGAVRKKEGRGIVRAGYESKIKKRIFSAASSFN